MGDGLARVHAINIKDGWVDSNASGEVYDGFRASESKDVTLSEGRKAHIHLLHCLPVAFFSDLSWEGHTISPGR